MKENKVLDKDDYFSLSNQEKSGIKRLVFSKGKIAFTIREAFKVYELSMQNAKQRHSA